MGLAERILQGMRSAQQRYLFYQARALAEPLTTIGLGNRHPQASHQAEPNQLQAQRDGFLLAQKLALVESDFGAARRWADALSQFYSCQDDPELRRRAHAEPLRQWRLEFGACPVAAGHAGTLLRQPPEQALVPLLAALEQEPQSTALAFALLLVLRRGGWFEPPAVATNSPSLIPRQLWLLRRHGVLTPALEQRQARWQELHLGWDLHWVDHHDEAIDALAELPELVRQACLCVGDLAVRGDLLRLALLWLNGGVAVDFGIAALESLDPLLAGRELLLLQDAFGGIDGSIWAAPPRHPWVEAALLQACRNVVEAQGYSRWDLSGSCLLSGVTARWLRPQLTAEPQLTTLTVLAPTDQGRWFQMRAPEPAPEGYVAPKAQPLLNRRRCSWLCHRWGVEWPSLHLAAQVAT